MPSYFESGFMVREPAWHGLGKIVDHALTAAEAIEAAGLDWTVATEPVYRANGEELPWRAVVRTDKDATLGVVGARYHPVQNRDLFAFFDQVVDPDEGAFYHTGGVLLGGRRVWLLAKVPGDFYVPGVADDLVQNYVLLASSHDGTLRVTAKHTPVRVVCWNTLSMALGRNTATAVTIRHTASAVDQLREAHKVLGLASRRAEALAEAAAAMRAVRLNTRLFEHFLRTVFPSSTEKDGGVPSKKVRMHRETVMELFEFGAANVLKGMRGTGWALYNATAEYADHLYPMRASTDKLNRIWFGQAELIKTKAAAVLLGQAAP